MLSKKKRFTFGHSTVNLEIAIYYYYKLAMLMGTYYLCGHLYLQVKMIHAMFL